MTAYAVRLENGTDTAARMRIADLLALPAGASPLTARSGLRPDGGGAVTVVGGSMNVQVAAFAAWIQGTVSVAQGGYTFVNDAVVTLALAAGHASLSRTDTIAAVVRDNAFDASGSTDARVIVVAGTPGAGAPALPADAIALRDVVVPAGLSAGTGGLASGNLGTDRRTYLGDETWTAFPYAANWADPVGFQAGRYTRIGNRVYVEFYALRSSSTAAAGSVIGSLPVGFRPLVQQVRPTVTNAGGTLTSQLVSILANGDIQVGSAVNAAAAVPCYFSFTVN